MISLCKSKVNEERWDNVELFLGCAEYLPFKDEVFDRVLIGGGISYFSDPTRAIQEAARVTINEGIVVIYEQVTLLERILGRERDRFPSWFKEKTDLLVSISRLLRKERELLMYGDEEVDIPPEELYTHIDGEEALTKAKKTLDLVNKLLNEIMKKK